MELDGSSLRKRVLITVRTYPSPSKKSIEASCTAGIDEQGNWIRLFPVPYRFLENDKRFKKYQYIEANVSKNHSDPRPESFRIDIDSIRILDEYLDTTDGWEKRKNAVFPLKSHSLCSLKALRDQNKQPTLGFFKPKRISRLDIKPDSAEWTESELASLQQMSLFRDAPKQQLEKLPWTFSYDFYCEEPHCTGHSLMCTDWEMGASYLNWKKKYSRHWETKFRDRFETYMILGRDTHFFVGTVKNHPDKWIIIGLFYPPNKPTNYQFELLPNI